MERYGEHPSRKSVERNHLNYDAEVLLGEEVQLYLVTEPTNEGLVVYIQGRVEDKPKFCVKMVF